MLPRQCTETDFHSLIGRIACLEVHRAGCHTFQQVLAIGVGLRGPVADRNGGVGSVLIAQPVIGELGNTCNGDRARVAHGKSFEADGAHIQLLAFEQPNVCRERKEPGSINSQPVGASHQLLKLETPLRIGDGGLGAAGQTHLHPRQWLARSVTDQNSSEAGQVRIRNRLACSQGSAQRQGRGVGVCIPAPIRTLRGAQGVHSNLHRGSVGHAGQHRHQRMCTAHRTAPGGRTVALGQHPRARFAECRGDSRSLPVGLKRLNRQCCGDKGITIRCQAPLPTRLLRAKEPAHGLTRWASIDARRSSQSRQRPCSVLRIAGVAFRSTKPAVGVLVEHQRIQMGCRDSGRQLLGQGLPRQYLYRAVAGQFNGIQQLRRNRSRQRFERCGGFRSALHRPCDGSPFLRKAAMGLDLSLQPRHTSRIAGPHGT